MKGQVLPRAEVRLQSPKPTKCFSDNRLRWAGRGGQPLREGEQRIRQINTAYIDIKLALVLRFTEYGGTRQPAWRLSFGWQP